MKHNRKTDQPENPGRRYALRRLAGAVVAAYVVPEILVLSEARAESSSASPVSPASTPEPSAPAPDPSTPSPSTPSPSSTTVSGAISSAEPSGSPSDACEISSAPNGNSISISRTDLARAQEAVEAGYAQPLDKIWGEFTTNYNGKVIGVEFTGRRRLPRYRFRAISPTGRLETVTISAQTGEILRIVGC